MFVFYRNKSRVTVMHYDTVAFSLQVKFIKGYREKKVVNPINTFQTQNQKCLWGKEQRLRTISAVQRDFCRRGFLNPYPVHARNIWATAVLTMGIDILTMAMIRHYYGTLMEA